MHGFFDYINENKCTCLIDTNALNIRAVTKRRTYVKPIPSIPDSGVPSHFRYVGICTPITLQFILNK